jgi:hypothetical protein
MPGAKTPGTKRLASKTPFKQNAREQNAHQVASSKYNIQEQNAHQAASIMPRNEDPGTKRPPSSEHNT